MRGLLQIRTVVFAVAVLLLPSRPEAAEVVIKFATTVSGDHIDIEMANLLGKEIEKRVPGKVDFQLFPGGQLGTDRAIMTGIQQGTHMITIFGSQMAQLVPAYGVFEAPFLLATREDAQKVIRVVQEDLKKLSLGKNLVVLAIGELGFRQISNNVRPIVKPSDLKGVRLRTPDNAFRLKMFRVFGANPTPMSYGEVYVALRQGVIDGQENPLGSIWGSKFHEVQRFISISNHIFSANTIVASKHHWDKWPTDVRKAVQEAAEVVAAFSFKRGLEREQGIREKMKGHSQFNDIDFNAFKKAATPLYEEIEAAVGKDLWAKVNAALK